MMKRALLIAGGTVGGLGAVLSVTPPQFGSSSSVAGGISKTSSGSTATPTQTKSATPKQRQPLHRRRRQRPLRRRRQRPLRQRKQHQRQQRPPRASVELSQVMLRKLNLAMFKYKSPSQTARSLQPKHFKPQIVIFVLNQSLNKQSHI